MKRKTKPAAPEPIPPAASPPGPDLSYIAEQLRPLAVPCSGIELDPANVRKHDEANLSALRGSLRQFGQVKVIVVNKRTNRVLAGNGTLICARELGWPCIAVVYVDHDPASAATFALADNRISDLSYFDEEALELLWPQLDRQCDELARMIAEMEAEYAEKPPKTDAAELTQEYSVLVKCEDEQDQRVILEELGRHGLETRALIVDFPKREEKPPRSGPELGEAEIEITRSSEVERTARVIQLEGMFDVPPGQRSESWRLKITLDRPWTIGLIVGPSGSGKTTVARELFGKKIIEKWPWTDGHAIIDDFPQQMPIAGITAILSSVGFSSPPSWLKPFCALSNGEQFRVNLARTLAEAPDLAVVDEFTSVVDRTVAQIGSTALAKAIRGTGRQFIAVACHYDIEEWLQPDWKIEMPSGILTWRLLRRRPEIQLRVRRACAKEWESFRRHHYLDHGLHRSASCFAGEVDGQLATFTAVLHAPNAHGGFWREHRTVCLPDFQGVGLAMR